MPRHPDDPPPFKFSAAVIAFLALVFFAAYCLSKFPAWCESNLPH